MPELSFKQQKSSNVINISLTAISSGSKTYAKTSLVCLYCEVQHYKEAKEKPMNSETKMEKVPNEEEEVIKEVVQCTRYKSEIQKKKKKNVY